MNLSELAGLGIATSGARCFDVRALAVVLAVRDNFKTIAAIGHTLAVGYATAHLWVGLAVAAGMVSRRRGRWNARLVIIEITPKGEQRIKRFREVTM